jgi:hypothetical protein
MTDFRHTTDTRQSPSARDHARLRSHTLLPLSLLFCALLTVACGEYSGGDPAPEGGVGGFSISAPTGLSEADQIAAFEGTLHPLLREHRCKECHESGGSAPFELADADAGTAYRSVISGEKVDFSDAAQSRLVRRLSRDRHHCWNDCGLDGVEMMNAIQEWIADIEARGGGTDGGGTLVGESGSLVSSVIGSDEGEPVENGDRHEPNVVGIWHFNARKNTIAYDRADYFPRAHFEFEEGEGVEWMNAFGLTLTQGQATSRFDRGQKLYDAIADPFSGSGEFSVEVWLVPANTDQMSDIFQIRGVNGTRNLRIRQRLYQYEFRNLSQADDIGSDGRPALITDDDDRDLQSALQHAVFTFDRLHGRQIFVNGVHTGDADEQGGSVLWNWERRSRVEIGEPGENGWVGQIRFIAIHKEALDQDEIMKNYLAGVGLRERLQFRIDDWAGEGATMEMSLSQLDDNSYLLCQPTIVGASPGIRVGGIRIRVNGSTPKVGQGFTNLNSIVVKDRQQLSNGCAILPKPDTVGADTFQLSFEALGGFVDPWTWDDPGSIVHNYDDIEDLPVTGIRDFNRVNESLAEITGVDGNTQLVSDTFDAVIQQLPGNTDLRSFVTAQQVGISKLALSYCEELAESAVADVSPGAEFFNVTSFDFGQTPDVAFATDALQREIAGPLADSVIGQMGVGNQPDSLWFEDQIVALLIQLRDTCTTCDTTYTVSMVKGACTAALASGAVTLH